MRGSDTRQEGLFSYVPAEARVPKSYSLRKLKIVVDSILASVGVQCDAVFAETNWPSIAPD